MENLACAKKQTVPPAGEKVSPFLGKGRTESNPQYNHDTDYTKVCPKGCIISNITLFRGDWGDVTGIYAEYLNLKTHEVSPLFDDVEENIIGAHTAKPNTMMEMRKYLNFGGSSGEGGTQSPISGIQDATEGFVKVHALSRPDILFNLQFDSFDKRKVFREPYSGFKVNNMSASAWTPTSVDYLSASGGPVMLLGSYIRNLFLTIGNLIQRKSTQNKLKNVYRDMEPAMNALVLPKYRGEIKVGCCGDFWPNNLSKLRDGCYNKTTGYYSVRDKHKSGDIGSENDKYVWDYCKQSFTLPDGYVITGFSTQHKDGDRTKSIRGLRVHYDSPLAYL